jgi:serralysin
MAVTRSKDVPAMTRLLGGGDRDKLIGGNGADTFVFLSVLDSVSHGRDTIYGFRQSQHDKIDVSAIDANSNVEGHQNFVFLGTDAFSGLAGELRYGQTAAGTHIYADVNGDKVADFAVFLDAHVTLVRGDFVL